MKRIVTIQDITCLGKCALTVALPVISAMGVEASVIPTALLSVHTNFPKFVAHDLTEAMPTVMDHWKEEGFSFDAIYTGYLGSHNQIALISRFIDDFRQPDTLVFLDPVLGDHGELYAGFDESFPPVMAKLCAKADVIVPNLTEAALLLNRPPLAEGYSRAEVEELLLALCDLGAKKALLTGVCFGPEELGIMAYDSVEGRFFSHFGPKAPLSFYGTGDVFASTCLGALTRGFSLEEAAALAVDFTCACIEKTMADPQKRWYSVNFEEALPFLISRVYGKA